MMHAHSTRLLISVRSAVEALTARRGGAELIDIKEPLHGPLGRAEIETVRAVAEALGEGALISAALGEIKDLTFETVDAFGNLGLRFVKVGLSGCRDGSWQKQLLAIREGLGGRTVLVPTAYADASSILAPTVEEVKDFAVEHGFSHFLIDTYCKDGRSLFDFSELTGFLESISRFQLSSKVQVVLAGSLRLEQVPIVLRYNPAWLAVRGAACLNGKREESICGEQVQAIARALRATAFGPFA